MIRARLVVQETKSTTSMNLMEISKIFVATPFVEGFPVAFSKGDERIFIRLMCSFRACANIL